MGEEPQKTPLALVARDVPPRTRPSNYPEPFFSRMAGREKRQLGDRFGLANFGVNLTRLKPGGESALMHRHTRQDEFIYILEGAPTLVTDRGEVELAPGMCAGFPADGAVLYPEIGDRSPGDAATRPRDDIAAALGPGGQWMFTRKDGTPCRRPDGEGRSCEGCRMSSAGRREGRPTRLCGQRHLRLAKADRPGNREQGPSRIEMRIGSCLDGLSCERVAAAAVRSLRPGGTGWSRSSHSQPGAISPDLRTGVAIAGWRPQARVGPPTEPARRWT